MAKEPFPPDFLFRKLLQKIAVFHGVSLLAFLILATVFVHNSKSRLATQFSDAFRDLLISGDNSQVLVGMTKPIQVDFLGVLWRPVSAIQEFAVPMGFRQPSRYLYSTVRIPIYFDEDRGIKAGQLIFYYTRLSSLWWGLVAWGILVCISIPIGLFEKRRMFSDYNLLVIANINKSKADIAAQVAHDIRSPLYALDAVLKNSTQFPERQRVIVRHAVNRIRDIANNLLEKNRQPGPAFTAGDSSGGVLPDVHLLSSLIDPVITEKRLQFEAKPGIEMDFKLTPESYGLFSRIQPIEFRRLLSNLVNNAVEALGDKGAVDVGLTHQGSDVLLAIADNGKGIPPEILTKLGRRGETHGKDGGSGLGLFHARSTAESWGGGLAITSEPGKGTTVTITLPKAAAPAYFTSEFNLAPGRPIIVLDDDPGVHQLWRGRLESARTKEHNIEDHHFSEPAQLRAWVKDNPEKAGKAICLFDYELTGFKETGLSLASELGLCARTILVTSRSEEPRIISECTRLGVRMIPKGLAGFVPISISPPAATAAAAQAVLLDDDAITHMNWEWSAKENGVELKAFTDPAKFMAAVGDLPKDIPLYIDSELGENVKGENIASELKEKGFTNIHLATGHPSEKFKHLPWLRVVTKKAPWGEKTEDQV